MLATYNEEIYMNKATLIELMAKDTKLPKTSCKNALESFIKAVETSLKKNKSVPRVCFYEKPQYPYRAQSRGSSEGW